MLQVLDVDYSYTCTHNFRSQELVCTVEWSEATWAKQKYPSSKMV